MDHPELLRPDQTPHPPPVRVVDVLVEPAADGRDDAVLGVVGPLAARSQLIVKDQVAGPIIAQPVPVAGTLIAGGQLEPVGQAFLKLY